jgi:hypothetical protein
MNAQIRRDLFLKVTFYYAVLCLALVAVAMFHPEFLKVMPFGGLDHWENSPDDPGPVINLDELKFYHRPIHLFEDSTNILTGLLGVLIIMMPVRWIYLELDHGKAANPSVGAGLYVLPMVVTAIIDIVQFSLALAFALAGVFAGVRYRTTLKSLADAFFTFVAIAVGLAAGTRSLGIGLTLTIFFSYAMLLHPPVERAERDGK